MGLVNSLVGGLLGDFFLNEVLESILGLQLLHRLPLEVEMLDFKSLLFNNKSESKILY